MVFLSFNIISFYLEDDYMATGWYFSRGSERNPLEMKVAITWKKISARTENLLPVSETELAFLSRANALQKSAKSPCIGNRMSARAGKATLAYAMRLFIFQPCWNLSCNRNNISACPTGLKFAILSPSWCCSPLHVDTLFNTTKYNINEELNIYV